MSSSEAPRGQALAESDRCESDQGIPAPVRIILDIGPTGFQPAEGADKVLSYRMRLRRQDRTDDRNAIGTKQHRMTGRPDSPLGKGMENRVSAQQNGDRSYHRLLCIVQNGRRHHDYMGPETGIKGNLAHIALWTSPLHDGLPPRRLPVKIFHLRNGTDHQRTLLIGYQDPDIVRFTDIVPPDEIVRNDALVDERERDHARSLGKGVPSRRGVAECHLECEIARPIRPNSGGTGRERRRGADDVR